VPPADQKTWKMPAVKRQGRVVVADNDSPSGQGPRAVNDAPAADGDAFLNRQAERFQTAIVIARHNSELNVHISQAKMQA